MMHGQQNVKISQNIYYIETNIYN